MDYTLSVRKNNVVTLLRAVDILARPGGAGVRELGEKLGLSRRSVYRLRETLEDLNFPLTEVDSPDREKRWGLEERYLRRLPNIAFPEVALSGREAALLQLLLAKDKLWSDTEIGPVLNSVRAKLSGFLPPDVPKSRGDSSVIISGIDPRKDYRGKERIIEDILRAVRERKVCPVRYHSFSAGTVKTYPVHPLSLLEHRGGLYLIALVPRYGDIRILAVERIETLELTRETFTMPKDYNPGKLLDGALDLNLGDPVPVRLRVSAGQAPYIRERRWAADQAIEESSDGSVVLSFTASGAWDLKRWVLSMGAEARLLEPEWLAEEIRGEIRGMKKIYEK
jgi:predicted DNA-binding transcriptional regulator YafY